MEKGYQVPIMMVLIHIALGFLIAFFKPGATILEVGVFIYGELKIIRKGDKDNKAAMFAAYIVGLEVLVRMSGVFVLPYEFGKYAVIILVLSGVMIEKRRVNRQWIWVVVALLFPAALQTLLWSNRVRIDILANVSGMMCLLSSCAYFYHRQLDFIDFKRIICYSVLPLISIAFYLFIVTPNFNSIEFTSSANFATSGGFGPNQVSSVLSFGWMMILLFFMYAGSFSTHRIVDFALFAYLLFRALFTFSRGGNFGAVLAIGTFLLASVLWGKKNLVSFKSIIGIVVASVVLVTIVSFLNDTTDDVFKYRYTGKNTQGEELEDITSNRSEILKEEFTLFIENPIGYGYGGSQHFRALRFGGEEIMSHNEFGRLLSENGILGIIIILLLFIKPIKHYFHYNNKQTNAWLMILFVYSVTIMMHSAQRIAMPGFLYGFSLSFLNNYGKNN